MTTPRKATRQIAAGAAIALTLAGVSYATGAEDPAELSAELSTPTHVVIDGCGAEDTCTIDYRDGHWHVVRRDR